MFFSPFSNAITLLGEEKANLSAFRTFVRFVLVWICRFPLPLGVWEGLRFMIVALPGLFCYLFKKKKKKKLTVLVRPLDKIKFIQDSMAVLITCKSDEYLIKNEFAIVQTKFFKKR